VFAGSHCSQFIFETNERKNMEKIYNLAFHIVRDRGIIPGQIPVLDKLKPEEAPYAESVGGVVKDIRGRLCFQLCRNQAVTAGEMEEIAKWMREYSSANVRDHRCSPEASDTTQKGK
jgi:hypothetical protein